MRARVSESLSLPGVAVETRGERVPVAQCHTGGQAAAKAGMLRGTERDSLPFLTKGILRGGQPP